MTQAIDTPGRCQWLRALNLSERLAGVEQLQLLRDSAGVDRSLGEARLQRWRSHSQLDPDALSRRLAAHGIGVDDLRTLLGESASSLGARAPHDPDWVDWVEQAYTEGESDSIELNDDERALPLASALIVVGPLVHRFRRHLRTELARLNLRAIQPPLEVEAIERMLYDGLPRQLLSILSRVLVLELNVLRVEGRLEGSTPDARFDSFIAHLRERANAVALLEEYPVLARSVAGCLRNWSDASLRFVSDLERDWPRLTELFPELHAAGSLVAVHGGAGDRHRGGRSVLLLKFASAFQLVYKPRPLDVDVHFQRLLEWVNARSTGPAFRTLRVLTCDDHGWAEYVARDVGVTHAQAQSYFRRQGGYLALLYLLEATDFHYENLVTVGEHPVLVDLEALFQPRLQDDGRTAAGEVAGRELNYSVLRVGLLPQRLFTDQRREGLDVSGLGARAGQTMPFDTPMWERCGMDDMHLVRGRATFTGSPNLPQVESQTVDPSAYVEQIVAGFTGVYRLLVQHREELLAGTSALMRFRNDDVRVLMRATRTYARLLQESLHPDVLRDALDRDRLFDALWGDVAHLPDFHRVIAAEQRDLWNGDVPVFTARPGARRLRTGDGGAIEDFLSEPSLEVVVRRLQRLDEADLARQSWYIRAAMTTLADAGRAATIPRRARPPLPTPLPNDARAIARTIGDRLQQLATRGERDASWIGLALINDRTFELAPLELDLYDGLPGVALFLAYLGAVTGEERYRDLATATITAVRGQLPRARRFETSVGAFNGWGGLLHLFTHAGSLWNDRDVLDEAEAIVPLLPPLIHADRNIDIIGGSAGCLLTLLNLHSVTASTASLEAAMRCGERLIETACTQRIGVGWMANVPSHQPLAGFSHGSAGIAAALFALAAHTGDHRYSRLARQALAYERTLFSSTHGNWLDVRVSAREQAIGTTAAAAPKFQHAWCHGAPGIALARLRSLRYHDDETVREEIDLALHATLRHGYRGSQSLCHGSLGNLEALLFARECGESSASAVTKFSDGIVAGLARTGPVCANPAGLESPGLMTGLAGIGYGLLRMVAPEVVPSILALEPPRARGFGS
jgi:type 2 lantibiotic biosynthesis protein LanM